MPAHLTPEQQKVFELLRDRQQAYRRVFDPASADVQIVLADLARFCRANKTTFHENQRVSDMLGGRRETFLRIAEHLKLDALELFERLSNG